MPPRTPPRLKSDPTPRFGGAFLFPYRWLSNPKPAPTTLSIVPAAQKPPRKAKVKTRGRNVEAKRRAVARDNRYFPNGYSVVVRAPARP